MSFSAGEPGIAQKENSSDDQRHRRAPRIISSPSDGARVLPSSSTFIGFGWVVIPFQSSPSDW
jgi:hypothetical protein